MAEIIGKLDAAAATEISGAEARRKQSLKFTLGDYCFWQFRFEGMVSDPPLTEFLERPMDLAAVLDRARERPSVYVIRSFPAQKPLPRLAFTGDYLRYVPVQYSRYYIEFKGTFKDYLSKFSGKSRSTWQRKVRKFGTQSGGAIDWRQYRTPAEMIEFYALASELSKKTYQEKMFREGFASYAGSRDKIVSHAEQDAVRGYILSLRSQPVAYVYCHCYGGTIVYGMLGYDQDNRELSPGDVLLFLIVEALFAEGAFRYMDFGEGTSWYKEFYSTGAARCARVYYFPKTVKNVAVVGLHAATNSVSDAVGSVLDKFNLRARIRRLLRRSAVAGDP